MITLIMYLLNTLHNLYCFDLKLVLQEIERVGKKYICVEFHRTAWDKFIVLQVTCECFLRQMNGNGGSSSHRIQVIIHLCFE